MNSISLHPQYSKSCKCEVCECVITYYDYLQLKESDYFVCNSFFCKKTMKKKSQMSLFMFKSYLTSQKQHLQRLQDEAKIKKEYYDKVTKNEKVQSKIILSNLLSNNSELSEEDIHLVRLPSGLTKLDPPTNQRIEKYSEHLSKIIHQVMENKNNNTLTNDQNTDAKERLLLVEQRFSEIPKLHNIADRLCGMCKGGCCPSGKEHAYLTVSTIIQLMKTKPELSVDNIHELYLSRVASKTVVGACINQTEQGCSLPREMRSNICNSYYCGPVKAYIDDEAQENAETPTKVIVVQWSNTNWNRLDPSFENEIVRVALLDER